MLAKDKEIEDLRNRLTMMEQDPRDAAATTVSLVFTVITDHG